MLAAPPTLARRPKAEAETFGVWYQNGSEAVRRNAQPYLACLVSLGLWTSVALGIAGCSATSEQEIESSAPIPEDIDPAHQEKMREHSR
jgi:hypothetical protein